MVAVLTTRSERDYSLHTGESSKITLMEKGAVALGTLDGSFDSSLILTTD